MSFDGSLEISLSDDSEDVDLLSVQKNLKSKVPSSSEPARKPPGIDLDEIDDDEPDWVLDYSQTLPNDDEARRKAMIEAYDDESDSFSDLNTQRLDESLSQTGKASSKKVSPDNDNGVEKQAAKRPRSAAVKSALPLVVASKLDESIVLLQSGDDGLDLSGDVGAVGRAKISEGSLFLDIKGVVYCANTYPCNTACVVAVGEDEAKITSVLDEAVTLSSERNLFASDEVVVHGDLDEELDLDDSAGEESVSERPSKVRKRKADTAARGKTKPSKAKTPGSAKKPGARLGRPKK